MSCLEYSESLFKFPKINSTNVHKCEKCHRHQSRSVFFFTNHVLRHQTDFKPFNCEKNNVENYLCTDCDFTTDQLIIFKQHINNYHSNDNIQQLKSYRCKYCPFETYSLLIWVKHNNSGCRMKQQVLSTFSKNQKWLQCAQCNYRTNHRWSIREHILCKHMNEEKINWFKCGYCDLKMKSLSNLTRHVAAKHIINWQHCTFCDFKCKTTRYLKRHVSNMHTSEDKIEWFKCDLCNFKTKYVHGLHRHLECRHVKDKLFKCTDCGFETAYKQTIQRHIIVKHTSEDKLKWFQCDKCSYKSKCHSYLLAHTYRIHPRQDVVEILSDMRENVKTAGVEKK